MHIHEDLQAVTYVVRGAVEHSDSNGNRGVLTVGRAHLDNLYAAVDRALDLLLGHLGFKLAA